MQTKSVSPESFVTLCADVSSFYGFRPVKELERTVPATDRTRGNHTFASVARTCVTAVAQNPTEPAMAHYATPAPSHVPTGLNVRDTGEFGLSIVGSSESLGEVMLIKTIAAILQEHGTPVANIRLNALGDRDSQQRFSRELSVFFRKHAQIFEMAGGVGMSENPMVAYRSATQIHRDVLADAPRSVNFLSEKSRSHFRTILEQLEQLGLPYQLDYSLMSDDREQRVLFAVDLENTSSTVVGSIGGRYDDYVRRMTGRKEGAAVHASIFFDRKGLQRGQYTPAQQGGAPQVYFVQLGTKAKLQGLRVVDMLRAARVPALQSFDTTHITQQLAAAQKAGVPHIFIMGQREVLDGTIIIRSTRRGTQATVSLDDLPRILKNLR
jgi:histidyl-tRNA synthetase